MDVFGDTKVNKSTEYTKRTVPFVYFSIIIRNFATMNKRICMGLLMVTMLMSCATQQERAERAAQRHLAIKEAVEKRLWCIDITSMHTMRIDRGIEVRWIRFLHNNGIIRLRLSKSRAMLALALPSVRRLDRRYDMIWMEKIIGKHL